MEAASGAQALEEAGLRIRLRMAARRSTEALLKLCFSEIKKGISSTDFLLFAGWRELAEIQEAKELRKNSKFRDISIKGVQMQAATAGWKICAWA